MNAKQVIRPAAAPAPIGPYSHAIRAGGFLFCSGQIPVDPATGELVPGGIQAQTRQVLANVRVLLDAERLTLADVIKTTVFLADMSEFAEMNRIYAEHFPSEAPARSTIQVGALPKGARVEIEVIAGYPD